MDENKEMQTPEELQTEPEVTAEVPAVDEVSVEATAAEEAVAEEAIPEGTAELAAVPGQDIVVEETPSPAPHPALPPEMCETGP